MIQIESAVMSIIATDNEQSMLLMIPGKKQQWKRHQQDGATERALTTIAAHDMGGNVEPAINWQ